jgi:hypothetical protein
MTQFSLTDIKDVLPQIYGTKFTKVINTSAPFLKAVKHVQGAGKNLAWQGAIDDDTDLDFAVDGANAPTATQTPVVAPVIDWALMLGTVELSTGAMEDASEYAEGIQSMKIAEILNTQFDLKLAKGVRTIAKSFYTGRGVRDGYATEPVSIFSALAGSYGGVTNGKWVGQVDTAAAVLSRSKIAELERLVYAEGSGEQPNFLVMDTITFNKYRDLFTAYTHIAPQVGAAAYNWAPTNLFYENMQIVRDRNLDSLVVAAKGGDGYGRLLMLNTNDIELQYKGRSADVMAIHALKEGAEMTGLRDEKVGIPFYLEYLAKNGYAERFQVSAKYAWKVGNPSLHGAMTKIVLS